MIHVWMQRTTELPYAEEAVTLSAGEIARAGRIRSAAARTRYLLSHEWLHECLASLLEVAAADVPLHVDEGGAPFLGGTARQLSLSHHGDWLALAVSTTEPVGVDVLTVPTHADFVGDTALVLSPDEIRFVRSCPPDRRGMTFAHCWTRKEAYAKMRRTGLTADLARVTLTPDESGIPGTSLWSRQVFDAAVSVAAIPSGRLDVTLHVGDPTSRPIAN